MCEDARDVARMWRLMWRWWRAMGEAEFISWHHDLSDVYIASKQKLFKFPHLHYCVPLHISRTNTLRPNRFTSQVYQLSQRVEASRVLRFRVHRHP